MLGVRYKSDNFGEEKGPNAENGDKRFDLGGKPLCMRVVEMRGANAWHAGSQPVWGYNPVRTVTSVI